MEGLGHIAPTEAVTCSSRATRRLRRAQEEFRTLKSLRDDGLIGEELFVARKNKLKAAISPAAAGKS